MKKIKDLLERLVGVDTYDVTNLVTSSTLNITSAKLRVSGLVAEFSLTGTTKNAVSEDSTLTLANINESIRPNGNALLTMGTDGYGHITTSDGNVYGRAGRSLGKGSTTYVFSTYLLKHPFMGGVLQRSILKAFSHFLVCEEVVV